MARVMYVLPNGEPRPSRGMDTPARAGSILRWWVEARRALQKELGVGWKDCGYVKVLIDDKRIVFTMGSGAMVVIDRKADALG